jgi:hypothetical protein
MTVNIVARNSLKNAYVLSIMYYLIVQGKHVLFFVQFLNNSYLAHKKICVNIEEDF